MFCGEFQAICRWVCRFSTCLPKVQHCYGYEAGKPHAVIKQLTHPLPIVPVRPSTMQDV
jgi:hypothetical protein